jgi:hypothetical protein
MEYKAYSFDLDDNLLKLPTLMYLENEKGEVKEFSTLEFEKIRTKLDELKLKITKNSFRNFASDKQFLIDIEKSTKAGSWRNLEKCIVKHTSIFAIITARGHSKETLKQGIKHAIIKNLTKEQLEKFSQNFKTKYSSKINNESIEELLDIYLDLCKFYPVSNEEIKDNFKTEEVGELKSLVFEEFQKYINEHVKENFGQDFKIKIGFSDDSISHLSTMVNNILKKHGLFFYRTDDNGKNKY